MPPKITAIIPTYNRANLIIKAIESVLNQSYKDFELFILDDGSTDNTKEQIEKYLEDNRVKYFYHENQGEAATVNIGWSMATGEYFTQINSDDTITPDSFATMVEYMDKNKDKVVAYPDFNFIDEKDNIISVTKNPDWNFLKALSNFSCYAASAGTFIRRSAFKNLINLKQNHFKYINDIEMYWDMALVGDFLHVPRVLANWRVHNSQISNERYKAIPEIEQWYNNYFTKSGLPECVLKLQSEVRYSIINYFLSLIEQSSLSKEQKKELSKPYLKEKGMPIFDFSCVQVGDIDLMGNKFNGHDLHIYLKEHFIEASHFVRKKLSDDKDTYVFCDTKNSYSDSIIKTNKFLDADIIHYHLIHNTNFDITSLPFLTRLKPSIITLHDPYFFTGHCIYTFDCDKWKTHCNDCPDLKRLLPLEKDITAINYSIKKFSIQNSNIAAIVASDYMENLVKQSPIWKNKKIYKLPFGINQELFRPADDKFAAKQKLGIDKDSFVIMFRSTNNKFKGINYIKKVLKSLKSKKKITLITVETKGLLNKFKNKYNIIEFGWLYDDKKLVELYQAADLFLMPSEQEAFGMMAIEAMSCAVPVVSIKGTSLESVTNSPSCGICVTPEELPNTIQSLIDNPQEIFERSKKSFDFARENYNKDIYIERLINIYKEVMQNHHKDEEAELLIEQIKKYSLISPSNTRKRIADNKIWRFIYRITIRNILKVIYGKQKVRDKYDKMYL